VSASAALAYIDRSHSALCITDPSSLAFCGTCHILQPCLNGLVLALATLLPPSLRLTVEAHYKLIAGHPSLIPVLLAVAATLSERFGQWPDQLGIESADQQDVAKRGGGRRSAGAEVVASRPARDFRGEARDPPPEQHSAEQTEDRDPPFGRHAAPGQERRHG
jgi:hypothetical protein